MKDLVITKRMVRDMIIFTNPVSVSELCHKIYKDDTISADQFNYIMALVAELEHVDKAISYDHERLGYTSSLMI